MFACLLEEIGGDALEGPRWGGVLDHGLLRLTGKALLARAAGSHRVRDVQCDARPEDALTCALKCPRDALMRGVQAFCDVFAHALRDDQAGPEDDEAVICGEITPDVVEASALRGLLDVARQ